MPKAFNSSTNLEISRILHAGYLFKVGDRQIVFDPIFENPFSRNCYAYPPVQFDERGVRAQKFDAVFISHFHDDHCSMVSLDWIDRDTPIYLYCEFDELRALLRQLGFKTVHALEVDQSVHIGAFEITPLLALDPEIDTLFHVRVGEINILNVVDSWIDPVNFERFQKYAPWDLVLWPFQTMREIAVLDPRRAEPAVQTLPPEWLDQLAILSPRFVVPSACQFIHEPWSWYNHAMFPITYRQFERELADRLPETKLVRLDPSQSMLFDERGVQRWSAPLPWVSLTSDECVEYDYREDAEIPSTASIARNFPELTDDQMKRVRDYCEVGILARYSELLPTESGYFDTGKKWRLSVYDSNGVATSFEYSLNGRRIVPQDARTQSPDWMTEISAFKLHASLSEGEALSSIYLRVNDFVGSPDVEEAIRPVDVLEDPLIRCLYEGVMAGYQKGQLARLK